MTENRIVSLVPSLTHTLACCGFQSEIVGCTQFCVLPSDLHRTAKLVGGTKDPNMSLIQKLSPTHIFVNEEENREDDISECRLICPTIVTFPKGPQEVPKMLKDMGKGLSNTSAFNDLSGEIFQVLNRIGNDSSPISSRRFLYLIWREPYMAVSIDTYISRTLEYFGFENAISTEKRYPELTVEEIENLEADLIFLSSEPYPFRERDAIRLKSEIPRCPDLYRIDGRLLSWYGTLTLDALRVLEDYSLGNEQESIKRF